MTIQLEFMCSLPVKYNYMSKTILANHLNFKLLYDILLEFPAMENLNSTNQVRRDNTVQHNENLDNDERNEDLLIQHDFPVAVAGSDSLPATCVNNQELNACFSWAKIGPNKINPLEIRAAITMSVNILPFLVCSFPVTCNAIALYWCIRLESDCLIIFTINPYFRNIFIFYGIYIPLIYMLTSREFRQSLSLFLKKRCISSIFCCKKSRVEFPLSTAVPHLRTRRGHPIITPQRYK